MDFTLNFFNQFIAESSVTTDTILFRLFFSFLIGTIVGFEREKQRQPAGLRTHILICMGSSLLMLLSIFIPQSFQNFQNGDPGRIAAQVVSGIGFLGAGAIMKYGVNVKGLTTAASIWVVAALGLSIGAGMYMGAILGTGILLVALVLLNILEKHLFREKFIKRLSIHSNNPSLSSEDVLPILRKHEIAVKTVDMEQSFEDNRLSFYMTIQIPETTKLNKLNSDLSEISGIQKIELKQIL